MSNHYHVLLNVDKEFADNLSDEEVIAQWLKLYREPELVQGYDHGEWLSKLELNELQIIIDQWRDNLSNISRFIGNLNEYIARKANKEDNCTGVFWNCWRGPGRAGRASAYTKQTSIHRSQCALHYRSIGFYFGKMVENTNAASSLEAKSSR